MSNSEYLARHNGALIILAVTWPKKYKLIGVDTVWYKKQWEQGIVLENNKAKLVWDFQFNLQKTETARRSDLILETKDEKQTWICDRACLIDAKWKDTLTRYRQLAVETREKRLGYSITIIPVIIGTLGAGMKNTMNDMTNLLTKQELVVKTAGEMQKTILMDSETLLRKVVSGFV